MFHKKSTIAPMKAATTKETDAGSFFAIVLGTFLVAFVFPRLASRMWTPKKKKQVEAMSRSDMIEMHMAEREMYRHNKNAATPNVFEPYEQEDSDGEEHDWDDEITVQSFLEVHNKAFLNQISESVELHHDEGKAPNRTGNVEKSQIPNSPE
jgi:hypothetical protein